MEFSKAFTFVFSDQSWIKKILILGLVSLIPIIGWMGYIGLVTANHQANN